MYLSPPQIATPAAQNGFQKSTKAYSISTQLLLPSSLKAQTIDRNSSGPLPRFSLLYLYISTVSQERQRIMSREVCLSLAVN
jgi:hypothetical protein